MQLIPDNVAGLLSSGASSECGLTPHRVCIWKRSLGLNIATKMQVASYSGVATHTCQSHIQAYRLARFSTYLFFVGVFFTCTVKWLQSDSEATDGTSWHPLHALLERTSACAVGVE